MEHAIKPFVVACVGDSITEGVGASDTRRTSYPARLQTLLGDGYAVQNYGLGGMTLLTQGDYPYVRQARYPASLGCRPDIVLLMLGTNDSKPQNWRYRERFLPELIDMIRAYQRLPTSPRVLVATSPSVLRDIDGITEAVVGREIVPLQKQAARQTGCDVVDIYALTQGHAEWTADGIHPNDEGYVRLADAFARVVTGRQEGSAK